MKLTSFLIILSVFVACILVPALYVWQKVLTDEDRHIAIYDYVNKGGTLNTDFNIDTSRRVKQAEPLNLVYFINHLSSRIAEFEVAMRSLAYYSAGYCDINFHFVVDPYSESLIKRFFAENRTANDSFTFEFLDLEKCKIPDALLVHNTFKSTAAYLKAVPENCLPEYLEVVIISDFDVVYVDNMCKMITHPSLAAIKDPDSEKVVGMAEEARHQKGPPQNYPASFRGISLWMISNHARFSIRIPNMYTMLFRF
eukprot:Platyproteum_vivax@DN6294_c0_g1_i2.p1